MPTYTSIDWSTTFFGSVETLAALGSSANMTRGRGIMGIYGNYLSGALACMWLQDARPVAAAVSSVKVGVASGLTAANRTGARTTLGKDGMVAVGVVDGTSFKTYKETAIATYAARGVITIQAVTCQGSLLYDSASDTYHYINARLNGSSKDEVVHWVSTDDMANWTEHASPDLYTPGTQLKSYQGNGTNACLDDSGNIHVVVGCASGAGTQSLQYLKWTKATDSWSSPATIDETGQSDTAATFYHYLAPQIVSTPDGYLHVLGHRRSATHALYRPYYFTNRTGSWSAGTIIGGDVAYTRVATMMPRTDSTLAFIVCGNGYSPNTANFQLMRYEMDSAGTIGASEVIDSNSYSTDCFGTIMRAAEAPEVGVILWAARATGSSNFMFQSSDLTWRVEDPPVTSVSRGTQVYAGTGLSHSGDGANFMKMRYGLARTTAGRIWAIYPGNSSGADLNRRTIYAKYSDDDGDTWSSEETVYDKGSTATYPHWQDVVLDANEDPVVLIHELGTNTIRFYRRESAVWTAKTSVTMDHTPAFASPRLSYNRTQAKFHLFVYRYVANASYFTHYESSDNCATWSSPDSSSTFGGTNASVHGTTMLGYDAYMDDTGVHHVATIGVLVTSNYRAVYYATRDTSGVWSTPTAAYSNTSTTGTCYGLSISHDGVIPRILTVIDLGIGRQGYLSSKDPLGGWSTTITPAATNARTPVFVLCGDGSTWCLAHTNSAAFNLGHFKFRSGRMQWENVSNELVATPNARDGSIVFGNQSMQGDSPRFRDGFFFLANGADAASWYTYKSSSITWGGLTAIYTETCANTWNFVSELAVQEWIHREISSSAAQQSFGGRQAIVAGSTVWSFWYDGYVRACRSTDGGVNWGTAELVASFGAISSLSACHNASDNPVIALNRTSNFDFYIYEWDGSSFVQKTQLAIAGDDTESSQILFDGTTYHLLYGFRNGTNRGIKHRTSTDLVTWSSATEIFSAGTTGKGPHKNQRLAACMGSGGKIFVTYSAYTSGKHRLWFHHYNGSSWGTPTQLHLGGGGDNLADIQSGLSIVADSSDYAHIAALVADTTYTSRVKVRYFKIYYTAITYLEEDVHAVTDEDMGSPSISLNGSTPRIAWTDSEGLQHATRAGGTWTQELVDAALSAPNTLCGPNWGGRYRYSRGIAGTAVGSEEFWQSSDALAGTGAQLENTLSFSQILSTQQRIMSSIWNFVSALVGVRSLGLANTWIFSESRLNTERPAVMANTWEFQGVLGGTTADEWIQQTWLFGSSLSGIKDPTKQLSQTLTFTSLLTLSKTGAMTSTWSLSQALSTVVHRRKNLASTWTFTPTLGLNFSLQKAVSSTWNFISAILGFKADEGCQPSFTPERPLPTSEDDVLHVYFIGPLPAPTLAVQLKRPTYGNSRRQSLQVRINRTRGGSLKVHARTPTYEPQSMSFEDNSLLKLEQVRDFLRQCKGQKVYYIDENNRKWEGYITSSDVDLTVEARDRGGAFELEFEGRLV